MTRSAKSTTFNDILSLTFSLCFSFTDINEFENFDLTSIVTPVDPHRLERLLNLTNYPDEETRFLVRGFKYGFPLQYQGPFNRMDTSNNIPFKVGNKFILWEKLMKEVKLKRVAGPFEEVPYKHFVQSPIGLVPKKGDKTRLIFHLSYDFSNGNKSINYWTPKHLAKVKYNDLDHAIRNCLRLIEKAQIPESEIVLYLATTDLESAFRILPLSRGSWRWVVMKARHPITNKILYFLDKTLPFGSRISCAHFTKVSNAIRHLVEEQTGRKQVVTNYLDDFLFIDLTKVRCDYLVNSFLRICGEIGFPVAVEKTVWGQKHTVFLGMLLLGDTFHVSVPENKRVKAYNMMTYLVAKNKATVKGT